MTPNGELLVDMNYTQLEIIIILFFLILYSVEHIKYNGVQKMKNVAFGEFGNNKHSKFATIIYYKCFLSKKSTKTSR